MVAVVCPPGIHEYVPPPDAVSMALLPLQIIVLPEILAVGFRLTVIVCVLESLLPVQLVTTS